MRHTGTNVKSSQSPPCLGMEKYKSFQLVLLPISDPSSGDTRTKRGERERGRHVGQNTNYLRSDVTWANDTMLCVALGTCHEENRIFLFLLTKKGFLSSSGRAHRVALSRCSVLYPSVYAIDERVKT